MAQDNENGDRFTPALCWSLGFLTLISVFNYLDRSLLGLVLNGLLYGLRKYLLRGFPEV